ncbi:hypothetical protein EVAR_79108_1 [Eumeta japonica]|uniref:Uncharacterized protein n=1 Tax=Eumeta variegata TaxID=151549 RepID=A0A4C1X1X5_EUMVA|nr:hypothetical protein EVAR_79108_1 [Eumeta japonica]
MVTFGYLFAPRVSRCDWMMSGKALHDFEFSAKTQSEGFSGFSGSYMQPSLFTHDLNLAPVLDIDSGSTVCSTTDQTLKTSSLKYKAAAAAATVSLFYCPTCICNPGRILSYESVNLFKSYERFVYSRTNMHTHTHARTLTQRKREKQTDGYIDRQTYIRTHARSFWKWSKLIPSTQKSQNLVKSRFL